MSDHSIKSVAADVFLQHASEAAAKQRLQTRKELFSYITPSGNRRKDLDYQETNLALGEPIDASVLGLSWGLLEEKEDAEQGKAEAVKEAEEETAEVEADRDALKARVEALESSLTDLASYAAYAAEEMSKDEPGHLADIGEQLASQVKTSRAVRDDGIATPAYMEEAKKLREGVKALDAGNAASKRVKTFYSQDNVGNAKYTVSFHDGEQTHPDGSPFFAIRLFKAKKLRDKFIHELRERGYTEK